MKTTIVFFLSFFLNILITQAQQKFEREYRVNERDTPIKARKFVEKCNFSTNVKWYSEESQDGKSFEAKTIKNNHKLSLEFDLQGNIIDVEKKVKLKEITPSIRSVITKTLGARFKKFKIKKIQVQWTGVEERLINLINASEIIPESNIFEIEVKGKTNKQMELFELLIDRNGNILKELRFASRSLDNMEF